jgi:2-amino-4-hydroxy-6-hydroxymethyldihydropteridine diphosphokinase
MLEEQPGQKVLKCSSWYLTQPVGLDDPEWFVNGVALLETPLAPERLMQRLLEIETALGRIRTVKWGPRVIDLDLLAYDQMVLNRPELTLPHPFLEKRRFVLEPMAEIAPEYLHPVLQETIAELRRQWQGEGQDLIRMAD